MTKQKYHQTNQKIRTINSRRLKLGTQDHLSRPGFRANGSALLPLALRPGLGLLTTAIFSFFFQNTYANSVSATSITLTLPSTPLSLDISSPSSIGDFRKSSSSSFNIKTDAPAGYTVSIKSKNSDSDTVKSNDLTNSTDSTAKIRSILAPVSEADFSSSGEVNTWGYLPNKYNSTDNTDFQPGPTTTPNILDKTSSPNPDSATNYDFIIAAKVDNSITSGSYSNTFVLTSTANTIPYSITYDLDSGTDGPSPNPQTGSTIETTIELSGTTPTKENSEFKGWCDVEPTNNDSSDPTCSGTTYHPGDSYSLTPNDSNSITLYAIWKKVNSCPQPVTNCSYNGTEGKKFGNSPCYMSSDAIDYVAWSSASSYCPSGWSLPSKTDFDNLLSDSQAGSGACLYEQGWKLNGYRSSGSVSNQGSFGYYWSSTPYDSYAADGLNLTSSSAYVSNYGIGSTNSEFSVRCLVTEKQYNITYDLNSGSWSGTSLQTGTTYDNSITLDSHTPTKSGYTFKGWCSSSSISNNDTASEPSCNGTTYQPSGTYSLSVGSNNLNLYAMWQQNAPQNGDSCSRSGYSGSAKYYGGYCWMWSNYTSGNWSTANSSCPSGWHLPSQGEFQALLNAIGSGSQLYNAGWFGYYWSSTQDGSGSPYRLYVNSSSAYISSYFSGSYGDTVRCVSS